jgi:hypothetical protein
MIEAGLPEAGLFYLAQIRHPAALRGQPVGFDRLAAQGTALGRYFTCFRTGAT